MTNPWEQVPLSDYEKHMKSGQVYQLQTLNAIMKEQMNHYPVSSLAILGIAGGNGLEHIPASVTKVYGVDVNEAYLSACRQRYPEISEKLKLVHIDLSDQDTTIPNVDLIIANLFIEYIGLSVFQHHSRKTSPAFLSCVIQKNATKTEEFVSDSPYADSFTGIEALHKDINQESLQSSMKEIGYQCCFSNEVELPNEKHFIRLDFQK